MTVWNLQTLNATKAVIEAHYAAKIAAAAARMTGMEFHHGLANGQTTAWSNDPNTRKREYGDGVTPSDPWAHKAIREGVGRGRDE